MVSKLFELIGTKTEAEKQHLMKALNRSASDNEDQQDAHAAKKILEGLMSDYKPKVEGVKEKRGLLDGCFDLVHAGHINAIR